MELKFKMGGVTYLYIKTANKKIKTNAFWGASNGNVVVYGIKISLWDRDSMPMRQSCRFKV